MHDEAKPDREAILARRAIFAATALAAVGCSSQGTGSTGTSAVVDEPTATATTTATVSVTATATATEPPAPRQPQWEAIVAKAPPRAVSPELPVPDKVDLEELKGVYDKIYTELERIFMAAPIGCAPKAASCSATWKETAKALEELKERLGPPMCGWHRGLAYEQRAGRHNAFLLGVIGKLETELADSALQSGDATTWQKLLQDSAIPQPCLKCAMPKPVSVEVAGAPVLIGFAVGASALDTGALEALEKVKKELTTDKDSRLDVRGHADPNETGDKSALAKARAEAVRDWLVKNGIDKARIKVVGFGANLPIDTSATDPGRAANRRVDFALFIKK